jgi:hypothetical protein
VRDRNREIAFVRDADELPLGAEGSDDLGSGGKEGDDAHAVM